MFSIMLDKKRNRIILEVLNTPTVKTKKKENGDL